jgi:o-succinylbenzoate synthase
MRADFANLPLQTLKLEHKIALNCALSTNMSSYRFTYSLYQRPFRQPLHTSHGIWEIREGIIIHLTDDDGRSQAGEIAPIPWFGSESLAQAIEYCQQIDEYITSDRIKLIPDTLPTCQFGFGSAMAAFDDDRSIDRSNLEISALLPTGAAAIDAWQASFTKGFRTFKWKIGVAPIVQELAIWQDLLAALPMDTKLRLDANGGLTYPAAAQWLKICSQEPRIEFIEQPLPPDSIAETIALANIYHTPIALDESVATFDKLQSTYNQGWRGIYVIKPGISGFPWRLCAFITQHQLDVVFSSGLETSIGRNTAFKLAAGLKLTRAMGFGIDDWFADDI